MDWVKRGEPTPTHEISSLRAYVNLWAAVWWNGKMFARLLSSTNFLMVSSI